MGKGQGKIRRRREQPYQVEYWIEGCGVDYLDVPASRAGTSAGVLIFAALQLALRPDLVNVHQLSIKVGPRSIAGVEPIDEISLSRGVVDAEFRPKKRMRRRRSRST